MMADFFDKLKEQVSAGITTVTTKSRVVVETTRLRRQMRRLAQEKKEALAQLGTRAYQELRQRGHWEQEGMQEAVNRIQELDRSTEALEKEITRLEALDAVTPWPAAGGEQPIATCTCGTPLSEGSKFCGTCGVNVQEIVAKAAAARCPRCGAGISATAQFCRSCGAAVTERQGEQPQVGGGKDV
jgi:predicted phage gp36 major capsid-like protein